MSKMVQEIEAKDCIGMIKVFSANGLYFMKPCEEGKC